MKFRRATKFCGGVEFYEAEEFEIWNFAPLRSLHASSLSYRYKIYKGAV
ncbi:hypothetical protein [uncultured Campylobacter sp.]|nr:hypothetical protein [uncultured Campylobacter sp.]